MNCTSSTIKTSTERNSCLKSIILRSRSACTNRYMNCSADRYTTLRSGLRLCSSHAIACIRWVLPKPTPPYKNNGLKLTASPSPTRRAAACANSFGLPTTNVSKLKRESNGAPGSSSDDFASCPTFSTTLRAFGCAGCTEVATSKRKRRTSPNIADSWNNSTSEKFWAT